jgi:class 3 adenylate cyclase
VANTPRRFVATPELPRAKQPRRKPGGVRIAPEQQTSEALEGERKAVTALFADIKGSTELEQDLDPEEARAIVDPALKLMIDAVRRYDGYVVQSTGDGIFALFGAPVAHEAGPQRHHRPDRRQGFGHPAYPSAHSPVPVGAKICPYTRECRACPWRMSSIEVCVAEQNRFEPPVLLVSGESGRFLQFRFSVSADRRG